MKLLTKVRKAALEDMSGILDLVQELAVYEQAPEAVITTVADYEKNFLEGIFDALVAEGPDGTVLGTTIYYVCWSTWKGRMLYLEDFVVKESARGTGIGKQLFDALAQEAISLDCSLMKWQVLDWNEPAINFYKKYNVEIEKGWWNVKLKIGY